MARKALLGALSLAVALPLALAGAAQAEMVTTQPNHIAEPPALRPLVPQTGGPVGKTRQPEKRDRVIVRREAPLGQTGKSDNALSEACRDGQFRQRQDQQQIAILDGKVFGAAVGGQRGLYDPFGRGAAGIIYVFVGQGTTYCRVYLLEGG